MILNIGCGTKLMEGAINMDIRQLPDTIRGDIRDIPFGNDFFTEIHAIDIIEHLTVEDAAKALCEIHRVLAPGGKCFFQLPSLRGIVDAYVSGVDAERVSWWIFGGQDYKENFHKAIYDRYSFESMLTIVGLRLVNFIPQGTNMSVEALKDA